MMLPVFASAVIVPPDPTFVVANTIKLAPLDPGMLTVGAPSSLVQLPANAIISGVGVVEAENNNVFTALICKAASALVPSKMNGTWVGASGELGVIEMR